jgi:hypothetical protein
MKTLTEVIEEMFLSYVRTENYINLSEEARNKFIDQIEKLNELAGSEKW